MRPAAVAVAVFVVLTVIMDWLPTGLNLNIAHTSAAERLPGTLIHCCVGLAVIAANLSRRRRLILAGAVWYTVVLVAAVINWWLPYLTGLSIGEIDPTTMQEYAANPRVLPSIDGHPIVPDVQHMLIHASILAACVLTWIAFVRAHDDAKPPRQPPHSPAPLAAGTWARRGSRAVPRRRRAAAVMATPGRPATGAAEGQDEAGSAPRALPASFRWGVRGPTPALTTWPTLHAQFTLT